MRRVDLASFCAPRHTGLSFSIATTHLSQDDLLIAPWSTLLLDPSSRLNSVLSGRAWCCIVSAHMLLAVVEARFGRSKAQRLAATAGEACASSRLYSHSACDHLQQHSSPPHSPHHTTSHNVKMHSPFAIVLQLGPLTAPLTISSWRRPEFASTARMSMSKT